MNVELSQEETKPMFININNRYLFNLKDIIRVNVSPLRERGGVFPYRVAVSFINKEQEIIYVMDKEAAEKIVITISKATNTIGVDVKEFES